MRGEKKNYTHDELFHFVKVIIFTFTWVPKAGTQLQNHSFYSLIMNISGKRLWLSMEQKELHFEAADDYD